MTSSLGKTATARALGKVSPTHMRKALFMFLILGIVSAVIVSTVRAQDNTVVTVQNVLCGIISTISDILSVLALMLFILGGTLYAFAHFLPATGNWRGNAQGWGMGMLMGGIISLILYTLAPFIVNTIIGINQGSQQDQSSSNVVVNSINGIDCTQFSYS